jgi:uncharacterized membrane protein (UPF0136 family)
MDMDINFVIVTMKKDTGVVRWSDVVWRRNKMCFGMKLEGYERPLTENPRLMDSVLAYALLLISGGVYGYTMKGSMASLVASSSLGLLMAYFQLNGMKKGVVIMCVAVFLVGGFRYLKTEKLMMLILSLSGLFMAILQVMDSSGKKAD